MIPTHTRPTITLPGPIPMGSLESVAKPEASKRKSNSKLMLLTVDVGVLTTMFDVEVVLVTAVEDIELALAKRPS
jgi:hypothetical protein